MYSREIRIKYRIIKSIFLIEKHIINLLTLDGAAYYYDKIFTFDEANEYFYSLLQNIPWKNDEVIAFGKHIVTKRKTAWYSDSDYVYVYSNTEKKASPWTRELTKLKHVVENLSNIKLIPVY